MDERDELSEIPGIGPARAQWLEATFGVRSFRDLSALSADDLEEKLKAEGRPMVARKSIESWIAEARARASEEKAPARANASPKPAVRDGAPGEAPGWKPVASFVVEFQSTSDPSEERWRTTVHHLEMDRNESWAGIDANALSQWMVQQLRRVREVEGPAAAEGDVEHPDAPTTGEDSPAPGGGGDLGVAPEGPGLDDRLRAHVVDGDGVERANLIRIDKPWAVVFSWSLDGAVPDEAGEWSLDVLLKRLGSGEPLRVPEGPVRLSASGPRTDSEYRYRFGVPTGVVTSSHVDTPFRAWATVVYRSKDAGSAVIAGLVDLGLLRFYEPARGVNVPTLSDRRQ
jgi:hypothetical protein